VTVPLLVDCDPGIDDSVALLLACASPEVRLLGVTTVAGNVGLEHTTRNALRVLTLAGRTPPTSTATTASAARRFPNQRSGPTRGTRWTCSPTRSPARVSR
jgi:inosine-uridine nucleoside N-ribohydrolase